MTNAISLSPPPLRSSNLSGTVSYTHRKPMSQLGALLHQPEILPYKVDQKRNQKEAQHFFFLSIPRDFYLG